MTFKERVRAIYHRRANATWARQEYLDSLAEEINNALVAGMTIAFQILRTSLHGRGGWVVTYDNPDGRGARDATIFLDHDGGDLSAHIQPKVEAGEFPYLLLTGPGSSAVERVSLHRVRSDAGRFRVQFLDVFVRWFIPLIEVTFTPEEIDAL